jgi:P-type E1-E2 ATPase
MIWGSLAHPIARALPGVVATRFLNQAAREGICFSHEQLVDRAGTVTIAAFCARGTVLHGEPEVAEVHPLRDTDESELLSLAAGAESVVHHPVAAAVLRAARTRSIPVDSCRGHNAVRGMGVRCVSSKGDQLILGSRELLLREKVAIAMAEDTLRALESRGLTALMLAQNSHLIGVIALQDSLRAGAKAAVQIRLDERIEPVLMSGDSRTTTEAVAHALAVEHVRPEIPASGRAQEIISLIEGGATVAVIGTSPRDDAALGAAPVPIVLDGAAVSWRDAKHGKERAIGLGGRHVLAAPLVLVTARRIRTLGIRALLLTLLPTGVAVATAVAFLAPLFVPPLVAAVGAALAARVTLSESNASLGSY